MRVVAVTRLWPNPVEPQSAAFNRQQFTALGKLCELEVLAPHAYLPGAGTLGVPAYHAGLARMPRHDEIGGIHTTYMRHYYVPRVDTLGVPLSLASLLPHRHLLASADVILASWAYPDACAVLLLAKALGKPCCVKVHGSDLNVEARNISSRSIMRRILPRANAIFSVSRPLCDLLQELGVQAERIHLVRNGVDKELFYPRERSDARHKLGLPVDRRLLLYVGNLKESKGLGDLMAAFDSVATDSPTLDLAILGGGEWGGRLRRLAAPYGERVKMLGEREHPVVAEWLGACDALVLPSWREGTPNAVLEAVASGRPVVATRVGGAPDVVTSHSGVLVAPHDAAALATAIADVIRRSWDADRIRDSGAGGWDEGAAVMHGVLERVHANAAQSS